MSSSNIYTSFATDTKKKGFFKHEEVEGEEVTRTHYYRFLHPWYRARKTTRQSIKAPLSKERIIDRHNGLERSIVLKQPYDPNLQVLTDPEATFRTAGEFWNAVTVSGTSKQYEGEHIMCTLCLYLFCH